jgi:hypothetical protein
MLPACAFQSGLAASSIAISADATGGIAIEGPAASKPAANEPAISDLADEGPEADSPASGEPAGADIAQRPQANGRSSAAAVTKGASLAAARTQQGSEAAVMPLATVTWFDDTEPVVADGDTVVLSGLPEGTLTVPAGATVTVTGTVTGATEFIVMEIEAGARLIWEAYYEGDCNGQALIAAMGDGIFEMAGNGTLLTTGDAPALELDIADAIIGGNARVETYGEYYSAITASRQITVKDNAVVRADRDSTGMIVVGPDARVIVDGGTVSGDYASIDMSGDHCTAVVNGGAVTGTIYAIGEFAEVTVAGGRVFSPDKGAVEISGDQGRLIVSGGEVISSEFGVKVTGPNINRPPSFVTVSVSGTGKLMNIGQANGDHAVMTDGNIMVQDDAVISAVAGRGIYAAGLGTTIAVNGGTISSESGDAVYMSSDIALHVNGGILKATTGDAIHVATNGYGSVTVSGGAAFAYCTTIFGTVDNLSQEYVIMMDNIPGGFTSATGTGVVVGWNYFAGRRQYVPGASNDILLSPATGATAVWATQGNANGIAYANGANSGFIALPVLFPAAVPAASIDYVEERLTGLVPGAVYLIDGAVKTADINGTIAIEEAWMDASVHSIVRNGNGSTTVNSPAQDLLIPERPVLTGVQSVNESLQGASDGRITGVDATMRISADGGATWTDIAGTEATGLAPGDYQVCIKAVAGSSFASQPVIARVASGTAQTRLLVVQAPAFATEEEGYSPPPAEPIRIDNTGNSPAAIASVTVSGSAFTISGAGPSVAAGSGIGTWLIQPKGGLAAGTYAETVTVTYDGGATATDQVFFIVAPSAAAPPPVVPPVEPPVEPPVTPPVEPPVEPPVTSPVDPPVEPPTDPAPQPTKPAIPQTGDGSLAAWLIAVGAVAVGIGASAGAGRLLKRRQESMRAR